MSNQSAMKLFDDSVEPDALTEPPLVPDPRLASLERAVEKLKRAARIAVIYGGDSSSADSVMYKTIHTRSWKSYKAVAEDIAQSLSRLGFRHVSLMPDDMSLHGRLRQERIQMAWLNTCGVQGHNPSCH